MKTTIFRVHEKDVVGTVKSFFEHRFLDHQISRPGFWFGCEAEKLGLTNPVSFASLVNIMSRREAHDILPVNWKELVDVQDQKGPRSQREKDMAGWCIKLESGEVHSMLWALGPGSVQAKVRDAHQKAVEHSLGCLEEAVHREKGINPWILNTRPVFAAFFAGADEQQNPSLHTTVFIPRRHLSYDKSISELPEHVLEKAHKELDQQFSKTLSRFLGDEQNINLPRVPMAVKVTGPGPERLLTSGFLFNEWRKIANDARVGALEAVAREIKSLGLTAVSEIKPQLTLPHHPEHQPEKKAVPVQQSESRNHSSSYSH